jgi:putative transposase
VNVFEAFAEMDEEYAKGYCLHPDAAPHECSDIVQAHSIQKRGGLAAIAEKNHILSIKQAGRRLPDKNGTFEPARLGVDPPPLNWSTLKYVFGRRRRTTMLKKRHKPEEIFAKLRQVEVLTSQGKSVADAIRTIGVTEVTYYRWRQEFGGLKSDQVKRLKNLEAENARLRRAVSDLTLDKMILAEAARGNY